MVKREVLKPGQGDKWGDKMGGKRHYRSNSIGHKKTFNLQNRSQNPMIALRFYFYLVSSFRASGLCVQVKQLLFWSFLFSNVQEMAYICNKSFEFYLLKFQIFSSYNLWYLKSSVGWEYQLRKTNTLFFLYQNKTSSPNGSVPDQLLMMEALGSLEPSHNVSGSSFPLLSLLLGASGLHRPDSA